MFYSSKYSEDGEQVYLYIVPNDVTEAEARKRFKLQKVPPAMSYGMMETSTWTEK